MSIKKKSKLNINSRGGMGGKRSKPDRPSHSGKSDTAVTMIKVVIGLGLIALVISFWSTIGAVFGLGLILLILGITVAIAVFKREAVLEFARKTTFIYWYRWIGAIVLIASIWGLLGIMGSGGAVGNAIINSDTGPGGFVRVTGLFVLALVLMVPAAGWAVTKWLFGGISRPFRVDKNRPGAETAYPAGTPGNRPTLRQAIAPDRQNIERKPAPETAIPASVMVEAEEKPPVEKAAAAKSDKDAREPRDLKQVSQDVWKKYGETATLLTADGWRLPPVEILDYTPEIEYGEADNQERARMIEEALGSYGVEAAVVQINAGPTVTQFGVEPGWDRKVKEIKEKDKDGNPVTKQVETGRTRVKVDRISSLSNDLALALAAPSIRIEAPIPGKSLVGIEVPNTMLGSVSMRSVIETTAFQKLKAKAPLAIALGKGAGGEAVIGDLAKMPHLLIAGATGSGKTVCLNALICCLLMNNTPSDVRFIMVDPKRVELTPYNSMPHLAAPVIVDVDKAIGALKWLAGEMDRRYKTMAEVTARNIDAYNKKPGIEKMPYLVLVIDELADLMMAGFDDVEHLLCRLAQMARAVGIHLVVATQRPSVDVITGLIKANFPTRISFAVTSQVDSRTILDSIGAEKLLGRGDMLYMPTDAAKPKRLQGCYVSDQETERMVYFWNGQHPDANSPMLKVEELASTQANAGGGAAKQRDSLFETAMQLAEESGNISASFLQRKLHIGYPRAARLADEVKEALGQDTDDGGAEVPADDNTLLR
ncbi:DNA segregation ATPase FtsK/SpoIIIE, S-DNA-T family [Dehalogenimonas formicexedens]|uniref:DNA segregation ATPase FtsK/SpoIIIE, S-DNA-T family n=1 Tax=Dehalogenimonas formicexedens TaxID=1839801 RepID=A0A1P8F8U3_9CHLR|nr:DNA translocase FtsK [Dehalogenimonas formicexedens]APV44853.1 DNA segregation ATPase FtsK/SpoIIIE, S-DNA-T family [Dehalogenimonas formicexedens]